MNDNDIKPGYVYHIKDEYFNIADDEKLMKNYESGAYRPTYFAMKDAKTNLLWLIPMSTQSEKYKIYVDKNIKKHGRCINIIIGSYGDKESVFLLQNMFPIIPKYIDHIHTVNGIPVPVYSDLQTQINRNFREVMRLHKLGIKLVFTDIDRLEKLMLREREK